MKNKYFPEGKERLYHLISVANVLHSENPAKVEDDWIRDYEPSYVIARAYQSGGF